MDWLDWFFGDPFDDERAMLAYLSTVFTLSVGLALFRRETPWSGAALTAAGGSAAVFFVISCIRFGIGPLFLIGLGMLWTSGSLVAFPTVGLIRLVLAGLRPKA